MMNEMNSTVVEPSLGSHVSGGSCRLTHAERVEQRPAQGKRCVTCYSFIE